MRKFEKKGLAGSLVVVYTSTRDLRLYFLYNKRFLQCPILNACTINLKSLYVK